MCEIWKQTFSSYESINIDLGAWENWSIQYGWKKHIKMFVEAGIFEKV
jgi:hypothetical protein